VVDPKRRRIPRGGQNALMSEIIPVVAIVVSLIVVAFQVREARKQARSSRRAELVAAAFFDIYESWALNRRAQVEPVDHDLLRTSSAGFYAAAFKLAALLEPPEVDALATFMQVALREVDDAAFLALVDLHRIITEGLGHVREPVSTQRLTAMFWSLGRNVPTLVVGRIEPMSTE